MKKEIFFVLVILSILFLITFVHSENKTIVCRNDSDCNITNFDIWCEGSKACKNIPVCYNAGMNESRCDEMNNCTLCNNTCKAGKCLDIKCYKNEDCGKNNQTKYCNNSQLCTSNMTNYCINPGTNLSSCSSKSQSSCNLCQNGCQNATCILEAPQVNQTANQSLNQTQTPPQKQISFFQKIINWFKKLFGRG